MAVRLDPFQNIVNVSWGAGLSILALIVEYQRNKDAVPLFQLSSLGFTGDTPNILTQTLAYKDDSPEPAPVVNPISDAMASHLFMWSRSPFLRPGGGETDSIGRAAMFFNLRKIKSILGPSNTYQFNVLTPGTEDSEIITQPIWWVWSTDFGATSLEENQANPFTTGTNKPGFPPIVTIPIAFNTLEEAEFFIEGVISPQYFIAERQEETIVPDRMSWNVEAASYKDKSDFPVNPDNSPAWSHVAEGSGNQHGEGSSQGTPLPEGIVTVSVNLETLEVQVTKA